LQLDQFTLQAKQLAEIIPAIARLRIGFVTEGGTSRVPIFNLHFQFFIEAVGNIAADPPHHFIGIHWGLVGHGASPECTG
jgi:hypothetical protein